MRIAQLAPPWIRVPPTSYGGIEWVVALLCDELVARGHDVTLFASGDSCTMAELRSVYHVAQTEKMGCTLPDAFHVGTALQAAGEFDIVHDHSGFLGVAFCGLVDTPILHTLHGPFTPETTAFYGAFSRSCFYNAISEYQRNCMPTLNYVDTVYNAIDVESYPFRTDKEDFALMVGRITPDKGTHLACEVARRSGMNLVLAGKIDQGLDREYYGRAVAPHVDGTNVVYAGEIGNDEKRELMARARCFLFPIQWPEPFGLVMAEAMACGTPVIAIRNGAVPEVVADGTTGFVVDDIEGMVARIEEVDSIDPRACREHVRANFSIERMATGYERNYETIVRQAMTGPIFAAGSRAVGSGDGTDVFLAGSRSDGSIGCPARGHGVGGHHSRHRRHDLPDRPEA